MASTLHICHGHNGEEAANVQAPGGWIIPNVKGQALSAKTLTQDIWMGDLLHKTAGPKYIKDVFHNSRVPFSLYSAGSRCAYYSR
jgi:hypothetical protein